MQPHFLCLSSSSAPHKEDGVSSVSAYSLFHVTQSNVDVQEVHLSCTVNQTKCFSVTYSGRCYLKFVQLLNSIAQIYKATFKLTDYLLL